MSQRIIIVFERFMLNYPENAIISLLAIDKIIDEEDRNKEMCRQGKLWKVFTIEYNVKFKAGKI